MVNKSCFGKGFGGVEASLFTISNPDGSFVAITDWGATVQSITVPDKDGKLVNVVMNCDDVMGYQRGSGFWGATIGRVGNRLGNSEFEINGKEYKVLANDGVNHLHGGQFGFDKQMWAGKAVGENSVRFFRLSPDGEEGYPGNLTVAVTFTFDESHKLEIHYEAVSDEDTLCNLTNHSYFNLNGTNGFRTEPITEHTLWLNADKMTECDPALIPTGNFIDVTGTPFDFRTPKTIGRDIDADNKFIGYAHGYDHNVCLNGEGYRKVAEAKGDKSGITMEVWTDQPGMQFFSSNRRSFCLETQHYPNANKQAHFPSIVLKAGDKYDTKTAYWFK